MISVPRGGRPAVRTAMAPLAVVSLAFTGAFADPAGLHDSSADPPSGGTAILAHEQPPPSLNPYTVQGASGGTRSVAQFIFDGLLVVDPSTAEWVPELLAELPEVTEDPFTITYRLKTDSLWSDGEPITADDLIFTYDTLVNPDWEIANRAGYELITNATRVDDHTVTFEFASPYSEYRALFHVLLPEHDLADEDFNTVYDTNVPVSSGPFVVAEHSEGEQVRLSANEHYHLGRPLLDEVIVRSVPERLTAVQQLRGGEIHIMDPQAAPDLMDQLTAIPDATTQVISSLVYEGLFFNFARPPLDQSYVREAIAMSIDREAVNQVLVVPLNPESTPIASTVLAPEQQGFQDNYGAYHADPEGAIALLESNGCTRDDDDVFVCEGERLEFGYVTTAGNERRRLMFELVQASARESGIQLNAEVTEGAVQFGERWPAGDFDIFNVGGGNANVSGFSGYFSCEGGTNHTEYCNSELDAHLEEASNAASLDDFVAAMNAADQELAGDFAFVPMFFIHYAVAHSNDLQGVVVPSTLLNPGYNATFHYRTHEWFLAE